MTQHRGSCGRWFELYAHPFPIEIGVFPTMLKETSE